MGGGDPMDHHYHRISATKSDGVGQGKLYSPDHAIKVATKLDENVGQVQGDLYSPDHAIKIATSPEHKLNSEEEKQRMLGMKDKVLEKLAAAAVPSESLENAKQFLEGVIKDFAGAAQGMTKDALHRIKTHLAVILPSVSPSVTGKDRSWTMRRRRPLTERKKKMRESQKQAPEMDPPESYLSQSFDG
ncbi:hypothetical protein F2Q69_00060921 [Brassica cretica]|uniref:Uncharacterized protein n=1 Tax=Brassica cretica TaxID=69181 RepID=A0A8S9RF40_BRACR|nr:hypothetical protein F2Q69_00060921 [Brassica cretica]